MMSSGEETEYFAPYGATTESKQQRLQKKQKRTRQRVDAGEPRNNYSSIPHFTSRPSFHSGGLYGSIFGGSGPTHQQQQQPQSQQHHQSQAQQQQQQQQQLQQPQAGAASSQGHLSTATTGPSTQQHSAHAAFGFFGAPGYGPAKMLNELLGRQVKQASDAGGSPPEGGHGMTGAGMDPAANLQSGAVVNCDDPATAELTQHMLRDILQGRKISALALQEQPNNNNSIHSNNNNTTADLLKSQQQHHQSPQQHQQQNSDSARSGTVQSGGEESGDGNNVVNNANHSDRDTVMPGDAEDSAEDAAAAARAMEEAFAEAGMEPGANLDGSDCEQSLPPSPTQPRSGSVSVKEEIQDSLNIKRSPSHSPCPIVPKTETSSPTTETKRARVENIVSTMRSSPALQTATVNGCKKRKLYQPQQQTVHHVLQHGVNDTMMDDEEESEEEEDPSTIRQKREEKDNLQTQLKKLHEQLAVMQQKYNELTSRIDSDASESIGAPLSPQPPLKPPQPHPPPYNGLPALPTEHPHAAAAAMYHMGQKLYLEQQQAALERMKQHQEATVRQQQQHQQQQQQHQRQSSPPPPPSQAQQQSQSNTGPSTPQTPQMQPASTPLQHKEFQERINVFRSTAAAASSSGPHITDEDLQSLSDTLKAEITSYLTNLIDKVVTRFMQQRRYLGNQSEAAQVAAEQLNKDLLLASQILERKSPRTKVVDRGASQPPGGPNGPRGPHNGGPPPPQSTGFPQIGSMGGGPHGPHSGPTENNLNQMNQLPSHVRSCGRMFQTPKPPTMYSMASMQAQQQQQQQQHQQQREHQQREQQQREKYCNLRGDERESRDSEQNEALSLVMTPKKKRHKYFPPQVTDTRLTPRTVSRILAQEGGGSQGGSESPPPPPPPRSYHPPPPMLPVSLPTSVAIPNPSLHESQVFSPYSPFFNPHAGHPGQVPPPGPHHLPASPPGGGVDVRDSPPLPHPPSILHPALLAAAQHGSPDYGHLRMDSNDRPNDCNSDDISYDGIQPTSSMLTPIHLRKAKLMFFWVRYPSSSILKMYFPDIRFNKNNTAQLVKWFSNFREFYYIQMEKYARQAVSEGVKNVDDLRVGGDSEIYRVLNLHYNRNNHIEVPSNFRFVVEQTLKEFFKAIQGGKDTEQSWKKSIYKVISRLDDPVPEYFKTPNFLQQLG
ncbi:homeobox protein prospero isoform X1 [Bombus affinis]|uniref:homeobox protein prospero isoform X1 n=1 Tax=Bombus affinis TaxID=309941 RepID=UPI0021B83210|nr:homeobox protein prospero isoform X1 [Bombus affinis]